MPDKDYIAKYGTDASKNGANHLEKNFSGYVEYNDGNYNPLFVYRIKGGKVLQKMKLTKRIKKSKQIKLDGNQPTTSSYCEECVRDYEMECEEVPNPDATSGYEEVCTEVFVGYSCYEVNCDDPYPEPDCNDPDSYNLPECSFDECDNGGCDGGGGGDNPPSPCGYSVNSNGIKVMNDCGNNTVLIIERDTSITNNPKINCILNSLEGKNSAGTDTKQTKYDDMLNSFRDGKTWNLTYKLGLPVDESGNPVQGQTHYAGNNNFDIIFNKGETDINSSVIGKTFIHEAFHAYLSQKALETWGSTDPTKWRNDTKDLTLNELFKYIEVTKNKDMNDISHNFMAENLDRMIPTLKEFIDPNNTLNLPYDAYKGLMLQGLQNSNYYKDNISTSTDTKTYNGETISLKVYFERISVEATLPLNCN